MTLLLDSLRHQLSKQDQKGNLPMHKAGGIISLIAGILAIPALVFTLFFSAANAAFGEVDAAAEGTVARGYLTNGLFAIAIVIVLSIVILNTHTRWPGVVIAI